MKWSDIKFAFRFLGRNRVSSVLNVLGLGIGIAALAYAVLLNYYERGFDRDFPHHERTYRTIEALSMEDRSASVGYCWAGVGEDIVKDIRGVESSCRAGMANDYSLYVEGEWVEVEDIRLVDTNFLEFTGQEVLLGDPENALHDPHSLVITESLARSLFGRENPLGKSFATQEGDEVVVSAVIADPPENSHLQFRGLLNLAYLEGRSYMGWNGGVTFITYIRLASATTLAEVEAQMPDFLYEHINQRWEESGWKYNLSFQPVREIHLTTGLDYDIPGNRSATSLGVILLIGIMIILLAVINYVNISMAIQETRGTITGIRKIVGASPAGVRRQAITEAFLTILMAGALAVVLLKLGMEQMNALTRSGVYLASLWVPALIVFFSIILCTTFLSGWFPARMAAAQSISKNLNNALMKHPKRPLRNYLIVFQFFIAIVLITVLIGVRKQSGYTLNRDLGFNKEHIVYISVPDPDPVKLNTFRSTLEQRTEISGVSYVSQILGKGITQNGYWVDGDERPTLLYAFYTDESFLDCFSVSLQAGRNFFSASEAESTSIMVNETLVGRMGWDSPLGKRMDRNGNTFTVVGVIDDFHFSSLYQEIGPLVVHCGTQAASWDYHLAGLRIASDNEQDLLGIIRDIHSEVFPGMPFEHVYASDYLATAYGQLEQERKTVSLFAVLAAVIASIGIFGLTLFTNARRTREVGIRKVNGAMVRDLFVLLNIDLIRWVFLSFLLAVPVSWYLLRQWLQEFAYRATMDWWIFVVAGLATLSIALLTVSWLSLQTARRNPADVLQDE